MSLVVLFVTSFGILLGCSGGTTKAFQETGSKTILVTATMGSVTRSIPLNVTIQQPASMRQAIAASNPDRQTSDS